MPSLSLQRGQRLKLAQLSTSKQFMVGIKAISPSLKFDISCFGLDENGKLSDERFFVFYNQPSSPGNAIKLLGAREGDTETFGVHLDKLPPQIRRLVWVLSVDGSGELRQLGTSHFRLLVSGQQVAQFQFSGSDLSSEKALMVAELYFKDEWRLNAIGQGFAGGLDAVLVHFGGEVADKPTPAPIPPVRVQPPLLVPSPVPASPPPSPQPQPQRTIDGKNCIACGRAISFWDKTIGRYNAITGRCAACESAFTQSRNRALVELQSTFATLCLQPAFNANAWQEAKRQAWNAGVTHTDLLAAIRTPALRYLEDLADQSAADGIITSEEDREWNTVLRGLELPVEWTAPHSARWEQEKVLSNIRVGNLPNVQPDFHLTSDEICHLQVNAQFLKETKTTSQRIPVRLIATNKKLYIVESGAGGREIAYAKFLRVLPSYDKITIELSVKAGAGTYYVENPLHVDAVLTTLIKIGKRQLVQTSDQGRSVPQSVKTAVWQRDGGKCVQCGIGGRGACLEYDHDIPFSRGGASTVGNIRLLCRRCNSDKGDKI
ncbi:hypothetical protein EON83_00570 [bacterium]|nr:MAG: hypothetical protein EON83_00570 [bacterium]